MQKLKSNKTLHTIMRSYILILLPPTLFGIMLYSFALQVVRAEGDKAQMQLLSHVEDSVNFILENMNSIVDTFLVDAKVTALSKKYFYNESDYLKMKNVQRDLRLTRLSNNYIDDIIVYFHASDTALSARYSLTGISRMAGTIDLLGMDAADFQEKLAETENLRFFVHAQGSLTTPLWRAPTAIPPPAANRPCRSLCA